MWDKPMMPATRYALADLSARNLRKGIPGVQPGFLFYNQPIRTTGTLRSRYVQKPLLPVWCGEAFVPFLAIFGCPYPPCVVLARIAIQLIRKSFKLFPAPAASPDHDCGLLRFRGTLRAFVHGIRVVCQRDKITPADNALSIGFFHAVKSLISSP